MAATNTADFRRIAFMNFETSHFSRIPDSRYHRRGGQSFRIVKLNVFIIIVCRRTGGHNLVAGAGVLHHCTPWCERQEFDRP